MEGLGYWIFIAVLYLLSALMKKRQQQVPASQDSDSPKEKKSNLFQAEFLQDLFGDMKEYVSEPEEVIIDELADLDIAEKDIADLEVGANSMARLISGDEIQGKVSFIATSADRNTRTFRVEIKVDNKDRTIRDGVSAEIFINSKEVFSHKISPAILSLNDQGKLGIRTVDQDNAVEFREIEILEDTTDGLWVSGLKENERIITLGQEYVFQGQTVNVKEISYPEA